ncbi:ribonuclease H1-like isoform X2 [Gordionus sp. m RMFG-2023]|uniref:ribonuclease H1-like isoform X2 n=1 Tax=Gordionus sp. m RMFG-2023 TaxID=3053472 RepID=UPI0031FCC28E
MIKFFIVSTKIIYEYYAVLLTRNINIFRFSNLPSVMPWYAVKNGIKPGIYLTWDDCKQMVKGFSNASFKKFNTENEALEFLHGNKNSLQTEKVILKKDNQFFIKNNQKKLISPKRQKRNKKSLGTSVKIVYVDGCCFSNGLDGARGGIGVYWGPDDIKNVSEPLFENEIELSSFKNLETPCNAPDKPTNNKAEIKAAHIAILQAKRLGIENLEIHTDSLLLINSITKWMPKWKSSNWKTSAGTNVKNKVELMTLSDDIKEGINIRWVYVRGHMGNIGNEAADRLAKLGASKS